MCEDHTESVSEGDNKLDSAVVLSPTPPPPGPGARGWWRPGVTPLHSWDDLVLPEAFLLQ